MKKLFSSILALVLIIAVVFSVETPVFSADSVNGLFAGGEGTDISPYLISTPEQLSNIKYDLDASYKLTNNIVLSDSDLWQPIGTEETPFNGLLDGCNYSIEGLKINRDVTENEYIGLFGYSNGLISNLTIKNSEITVSGTSDYETTQNLYIYVGIFAGSSAKGQIKNCKNYGKISINYTSTAKGCIIYCGGIAGYANSIKNCENYAELTGQVPTNSQRYADISLGGVAGRVLNAVYCKNYGDISGNIPSRSRADLALGGIAGRATNVSRSYNVGNIIGVGSYFCDVYFGGICGVGASDCNLKECYNTGAVYSLSNSQTGGIVGYIGGNGEVTDSFNTGAVNGGWCGGIVGDAFGAVTLENCYNTGLIGDGNGKPILCDSTSPSAIRNCYFLEDFSIKKYSEKAFTADQMKNRATFEGFDFQTVWRFEESGPKLANTPFEATDINLSDAVLDRNVIEYHTLEPEVTVEYLKEPLVLGKDYVLRFVTSDTPWVTRGYKRYVSGIGKAKIQIIGIGRFYNVKQVEFEIEKFDISNAELWTSLTADGNGGYTSTNFSMENFEFDGKEKIQTGFRVCDPNDTVATENYDVVYKNNINVGRATMLIVGKGEYYTGVLEKTFEIYPRAISDIRITTLPEKLVYLQNETKLDLTGGEVTVFYADGTTEEISMTSDRLSYNFAFYGEGTTNIWVYYEGAATYYQAEVIGFKSGTVKLVSAVNTGNSVKLTWEEYAGADKYRIYKKNGTKWERFTDDVTTLSAEIKGLTNGNTYTFSVRAFRGKEYSNYDKTGITKKYVVKPSKTTGVKATVATYNSVKLSWKKQSGVTGYQIYRDGKKIADIKGASNVTYTDKSLVCGEDYDYKVRARKYDGEKYLYGAFSSEIEITPKPLKTTLSSVTNVSGKKAKLTWKKQSGVTGYQIYRSTDNKTFTKVKDIKGASNVTYTNSSLTKGKTYYYKVRARKYNGEEYVYGSFSSVKSIKISK